MIKLLEFLCIGMMGSLVLLYCLAAALLDLWQQLVLVLLLWNFMPGIKLPKAAVAAVAHLQSCYSRNCIFEPQAGRWSKSCNVYFHDIDQHPAHLQMFKKFFGQNYVCMWHAAGCLRFNVSVRYSW